jgi:hypothetical protein
MLLMPPGFLRTPDFWKIFALTTIDQRQHYRMNPRPPVQNKSILFSPG